MGNEYQPAQCMVTFCSCEVHSTDDFSNIFAELNVCGWQVKCVVPRKRMPYLNVLEMVIICKALCKSTALPLHSSRSLYARSNVIIRKFASASLSTKTMLINAYCSPVRSGVRCSSTPIINWMLHVMMPLDTCCMNLDGAARHNFLWPIMCLRLLPIFVNWCILCGDPWMLRTMFLLMLHYVLIYLLDQLFLDDGAIFCFNFQFLLLMCFFHCILLHGLWACYWICMNELT